jgi:drug/metabolite transporter (DMT)-like permease
MELGELGGSDFVGKSETGVGAGMLVSNGAIAAWVHAGNKLAETSIIRSLTPLIFFILSFLTLFQFIVGVWQWTFLIITERNQPEHA